MANTKINQLPDKSTFEKNEKIVVSGSDNKSYNLSADKIVDNILQTASSDATTKANIAETNAKNYADGKDADTLTSSKSYTDTKLDASEVNVKTYADSKDATVLTNSKEYTDTQVVQVTQNINRYTTPQKTYLSITAMKDDMAPIADDGQPFKLGWLVNIETSPVGGANDQDFYYWENTGIAETNWKFGGNAGIVDLTTYAKHGYPIDQTPKTLLDINNDLINSTKFPLWNSSYNALWNWANDDAFWTIDAPNASTKLYANPNYPYKKMVQYTIKTTGSNGFKDLVGFGGASGYKLLGIGAKYFGFSYDLGTTNNYFLTTFSIGKYNDMNGNTDVFSAIQFRSAKNYTIGQVLSTGAGGAQLYIDNIVGTTVYIKLKVVSPDSFRLLMIALTMNYQVGSGDKFYIGDWYLGRDDVDLTLVYDDRIPEKDKRYSVNPKPYLENSFFDADGTTVATNADGSNYTTYNLKFGLVESANVTKVTYSETSDSYLKTLGRGVRLTSPSPGSTITLMGFVVDMIGQSYQDDYFQSTAEGSLSGWINKNDIGDGIVMSGSTGRTLYIGTLNICQYETDKFYFEINDQIGDWYHFTYTSKETKSIYIDGKLNSLRILDAKYCSGAYKFASRDVYQTWADAFYPHLKGKTTMNIGDSNSTLSSQERYMKRYCAIKTSYNASQAGYFVGDPINANSLLNLKEFVVAMNPDIVYFNCMNINGVPGAAGSYADVTNPVADSFYKWYYQLATYIISNTTPVTKGVIVVNDVLNLKRKCIFMNPWYAGYKEPNTMEEWKQDMFEKKKVIKEIADRFACGSIDILNNSGWRVENSNDIAGDPVVGLGDGIHPPQSVKIKTAHLMAEAAESYFKWGGEVHP